MKTSIKSYNCLGVDFGGVLIPMRHPDQTQSGVGQRFLLDPIQNARERLNDLCEVFQNRVWLISHCGELTEPRIMNWLEQHHFFDPTGLLPDHLRFCRERSQKAAICSALGITHFIDDHVEVLEFLRGIVPNLYLFGDQTRNACNPSWFISTVTWNQVYMAILRDFPVMQERQ